MKIDGMSMFRVGQLVRVIEHDDPRVKGVNHTVRKIDDDGSILFVGGKDFPSDSGASDCVVVWPEQCRPL